MRLINKCKAINKGMSWHLKVCYNINWTEWGEDNESFKKAIKESQDYYENFITRSVHSSNKIEGNTLSYAETYAIIFNDNSFSLSDVKPREIYEAINLKYALQESLKQQDNEINPSLIVKLNEIINKNIKDTSGYRKIPVFIRGADFVPPEAKYVSNMVMEQLYFYNHSTLPLLERIADFHIQFEHIHPFEDGNGRTGRLLINHELIRNNEIPIVIPDNKRAEYFEYLQNYDVKGLAHMIEELQKVEKEKMNLYVKEIVSEDIDKSIEEDFEDRDIWSVKSNVHKWWLAFFY